MSIKVEKIKDYNGHKDSIYGLCKGIKPDTFISGGGDGYIVEWNIDNQSDGKLIARIEGSVYTLYTETENPYLYVGTAKGDLYIFDLVNTALLYILPLHSGGIFDILKIDQLLYTAGADGIISVINLSDYTLYKKIKVSDKSIRIIIYNHHTQTIFAGCSDSYIYQIPLNNLDQVSRFYGHENTIFALLINPLNQELISGGRDAQLHIHDIEKQIEINKIPAHLLHIKDIIYIPKFKIFATCSMDKSIKLWDAQTYTLLKVLDKPKYFAHASSVNKLLLFNDYMLISVSDDKNIIAWNLSI
jgi:WD40 repeat protein